MASNQVFENNTSQIHPAIFGVADYSVFTLTLSISAAIGVYFGFIKKNSNNTAEEYLHGGRQMKTLPIAISLIASQLSGLTVMTGKSLIVHEYMHVKNIN